jgi:hypothetical protein
MNIEALPLTLVQIFGALGAISIGLQLRSYTHDGASRVARFLDTVPPFAGGGLLVHGIATLVANLCGQSHPPVGAAIAAAAVGVIAMGLVIRGFPRSHRRQSL